MVPNINLPAKMVLFLFVRIIGPSSVNEVHVNLLFILPVTNRTTDELGFYKTTDVFVYSTIRESH